MSEFHSAWGYVAVVLNGLVGIWGVAMSKRQPPKVFLWAVGAAIVSLLLQVTLGVIVANTGINPGNQHVFYGVVIVVTLVFSYIYRAQFRKRPTLYYGLLMLFTMGLGIRGIMTFGGNF